MRPGTVARGLACMTIALALAGACTVSEPEPVMVSKAYAKAVRSRRVESLLPLLEQSALVRLEDAAERASDQVGGRRNIGAEEMLQIVESDPLFEVVSAELVDDDGRIAHVRLVGMEGESHLLELVQEQGAWKVRIPFPGAQSNS